MDELLREFLTETSENLDVADAELVKFERDPNNLAILNNIFRLVHTIKGTCGFIGLPRLATLAHAAETLMDEFRQGASVTSDAVSLVLRTIDRIKAILAEIEASEGVEPEGSDADLIGELERMAAGAAEAPAPEPVVVAEPAPPEPSREIAVQAPAAKEPAAKVPSIQVLERELQPGEVSLEELERLFLETPRDPPRSFKEPARTEVVPAKPSEPSPAPVAAPAPAPGPEPAQAHAADPTAARGDDHSGGVAGQTIRVNVSTLEHLMTMVSELVLTRNQLLEIARRHEDSEYKISLQRLSAVTVEIQEAVMRTRMQPIGNAWQKLPRIIRDLAKDLGKQIELEMVGADTELDRQVLDIIRDPLTHMVRNSADHGLESTLERRAAGKSEIGKIRLAAYHEGGHIIIEVGDDGRGLNIPRIRSKALERGLATEAELAKMSEAQIQRFIFHAGFSTADKITNISGRGVGMDVVRSNLEMIGGTIDVRSKAGAGSVFLIRIPLTLAIMPALIVQADSERFAIPQRAVLELVQVQNGSEYVIEHVKDAPVLRLRDSLLPIVRMSHLLTTGSAAGDSGKIESGFVAVLQVGTQTFGLVVDAVLQTEEIVVKPLASVLRGIGLLSGSTILGDGRVIMIIDPNGVAEAMASSIQGAALDSAGGRAEIIEEIENRTELLLFRAGDADPKAVPLSLVTRLEEFEVDKVERTSNGPVIQYRGTLIPLYYLNDKVERRATGTQPMLVFSDNGRSLGLVVDEIVDIVEERLDITLVSNNPGVLGSAIVAGRATDLIDIAHILSEAFADWFERGKTDSAGRRRGRNLLLVDDSAFFRGLITPLLHSAGFNVTACATANDALERLNGERRYDIIVSDIDMPGMDGFAFTNAVRSRPQSRSLPIIALSGICTPEAIERGREVGFSDYIAKSDRSGLIAVLREFANVIEEEAA